jgi:Tfp pilus assembly protein PilN
LNDYNFLSELEKKKRLSIDIKSPVMFSVIIIAIIVLISCGVIARNMILTNQLNNATASLELIKVDQKYIESARIQASIQAMTEYDTSADVSLKAFAESGILGTTLLNKFAASVPATVSFTSLTFSSSKLDISCNVPTRKVAAELLLDLKNSGLFQDVQLSSVTSNTQSTGYAVIITSILKAGVIK